MLRNSKDIKVVFFMLITSGLLAVNWQQSEPKWYLVAWACMMAVSVTTITHNHNHKTIWKNKYMNMFQDYWLTVFYGFPPFAWIPTHNQNHHKFNNKEGDYTITYRVSESNNFFTLMSYPTISSYWQQKAIKIFLQKQWDKNRKRFWYYISEYAVLVAWVGGALLLDWKKALLYIIIPQQVGLFAVLAFNYLQHVGTDEESEWAHSRDMLSPVMNALLFNNGYHTVHHIKAGLHWSKGPEEHAKIQHHLDPALTERSFWWFIIREYFIGLFVPSVKAPNRRLERMKREQEEASGGMGQELAAAE